MLNALSLSIDVGFTLSKVSITFPSLGPMDLSLEKFSISANMLEVDLMVNFGFFARSIADSSVVVSVNTGSTEALFSFFRIFKNI